MKKLHLALGLISLIALIAAPHFFKTYGVYLLTYWLIYVIANLGLNLIVGYAGLKALGHAAFFSLGGYAMGMYLMRRIGSRGVYGDAMLPDFMVFLNWKKLPWFWLGFDHFWFAAIMMACVPSRDFLIRPG